MKRGGTVFFERMKALVYASLSVFELRKVEYVRGLFCMDLYGEDMKNRLLRNYELKNRGTLRWQGSVLS